MPRKEFITLMEENVKILHRLSDRLKLDRFGMEQYPRQQIEALVRLHLGGRARLKDIAAREMTTTANLCAMYRNLERDGLVMRTIDEDDRRNTWYDVTKQGAELAGCALCKFREGIESLFSDISRADEANLTSALKIINQILKNTENKNA